MTRIVVSLALVLSACGSSDPSSDSSISSGATDVGDASETGGSSCGTTVFLNFDGGTFTFTLGNENATQSVVPNPAFAGLHFPYEGGDAADILSAVQAHFAPFDVCVTDIRPDTGDYEMVVFTPTNPFSDSPTAIGSYDCGNTNPSNIAFVYTDDSSRTAAQRAHDASGRVGVAMGLNDQTVDGTDLMHVGGGTTPSGFVDACIVKDQAECPDTGICGANEQNSYQHLLDLLGPA